MVGRVLGIDTSHVKRVEGRNGIYFISIFGHGEREFTYYRAGSAPSTMTPADLDPHYIAQAKDSAHQRHYPGDL